LTYVSKYNADLKSNLEALMSGLVMSKPFGIVFLRHESDQPEVPGLDSVCVEPYSDDDLESIKDVWEIKLNPWARAVYYYLSTSDDPAVPEHIWCINDGMPQRGNKDGRPVAPGTEGVLFEIIQYDLGKEAISAFEYNQFKLSDSGASRPPTKYRKVFTCIAPAPADAWNVLAGIRSRSDVPAQFFDDVSPPDGELIAGLKYYQADHTTSPATCTVRFVSDDWGRVIKKEVPYAETPAPWDFMIVGHSLKDAVINDCVLQYKIGWPRSPDIKPKENMHPVNWRVRELTDDMPAYPLEDSLEEETRKIIDKNRSQFLENRWLYWTFESERWDWPEIIDAFIVKFGPLARPKKSKQSEQPTEDMTSKRRTAKRRCKRYAELFSPPLEVRDGRD